MSKNFFYEHYKTLIGKKVVGICHDVESEMYGLKLQGGNSKRFTVAWIQCDTEGNGPGFLQMDDK